MDQWEMLEKTRERESQRDRSMLRYVSVALVIIVLIIAGANIITSCLCGG